MAAQRRGRGGDSTLSQASGGEGGDLWLLLHVLLREVLLLLKQDPASPFSPCPFVCRVVTFVCRVRGFVLRILASGLRVEG